MDVLQVRVMIVAFSGILSVFLLLLSCIFETPLHASERQPLVVILNSYHQGEKWSDNEIEGIMGGLKNVYPHLMPSVEHLDAKRFPSRQHLDNTTNYLSNKYQGRIADLLIILDNPALEMVKEWEKGPFENIPKVFAGINGFNREMIAGIKNITGVVEEQDLEGTLRLALTLHPHAKEALLIADATSSGLALRSYVEGQKEHLYKKLSISFAGEGSFAELEARLRALSGETVVVILTYVTDASGRTFTREESTKLISQAAGCPVYAMHEARLGHGIVGGVLLEGKEHGRQAAQIALRILAGEPPWTIPVQKSISRRMLDYRMLVRHGVPEGLWPKDALFVNRPASSYEAYRYLVLPVSIVAAGLAVAVVILGYMLRRVRIVQKALRERERDLVAALEAYPESALLLSRNGTILTLNTVAAGRLGLSQEESGGRSVYDLLPETVAESRRRRIDEVIERDVAVEFEDERGGRVFYHHLVPVKDEKGSVSRVAVFARDITEERERERLLRDQNELLRSVRKVQEIFISGIEPAIALEEALKILVKTTMSNCGCIEEIESVEGGLSTRNLASWREPESGHIRGCFGLAAPELCSAVFDRHREDLTRGEILIEDLSPYNTSEAQDIEKRSSCQCMAFPLQYAQELVGFIAVAGNPEGYSRDSSERIRPLLHACSEMIKALRARRMEEKQVQMIEEGEERYRALFESTDDAIVVLDKKRAIVSCNRGFLRLLGYEFDEVSGRSTKMLYFKEEDYEAFGRNAYPEINEKGSHRTEITLRKRNGDPVIVETITSSIRQEGEITGYVAILRDLTEKKKNEAERERLKDELNQAQKFEALGTLAGGIAHDFNNILGIIMGSADLALMEARQGSGQSENLALLLRAAKRAKDLVNQILAFSRRSKQELKPLRLDLVVSEALKFLRSTLPSTIEVRKNIEKDGCTVYADLTQVHQVIMNLCVNAAHAMREKGGVLEVSVNKVALSPSEGYAMRLQGPGPYCRLMISDTGHGIAPEIMDKIFDPYFTTKKKEEGTGLGLSVVKDIVEGHRGAVRVESRLGKGSVFEVFFPLAEPAAEGSPAAQGDIRAGRGERILVVDDEPDPLKIISEMLKGIGYEIETRPDGEKALEAIIRDPGRYSMVITDMTMPNMTGLRLASRIKEVRNDLPVVVCTGFSELLSEEAEKRYGLDGLLMKPVSKTDLAETASKLIGRFKRSSGEKP